MRKPDVFSSKFRNLIILSIILLLILGFVCFWRNTETSQQEGTMGFTVTEPADDSAQRLLISVVKNEEIRKTTIFSPESSDTGGDVFSRYLESVDIQLHGTTKPLEEALRDGSVSFQEIIAWAVLDAENGFCKEIVETERGLTMFRYIYRGFALSVFNDVYQTPDDKEHLIRECTFYPPGESVSIRSTIVTDENGAYLDREDWGISLELIEASPSDITFQVHQSGGQHIGSLVTDLFMLDCKTTKTAIHRMTKEFPIENGATTTIYLNWEDDYGRLPSGTYSLILGMTDIFTEEQRHPLMLDYHDWQAYGLEFVIP